jgi:hypothetical protein
MSNKESWRDDYNLLKRATKDLNVVLKKGVGLTHPNDKNKYWGYKNSRDRTEEEDEILYNWSKKWSEKLNKLMKRERDRNENEKIPIEVLRPLFKENGYNYSLISDITSRWEFIEHQVEQNVSEKVGKKLEGKLGKDIANKIAEFFDDRQEGYERIEYDKHGKRRKYRAKLKYEEPRFEPTFETDSSDEEMERRRIKKELEKLNKLNKNKNIENNKNMSSKDNKNMIEISSDPSSDPSSDITLKQKEKQREKQRAEAYRLALQTKRRFQRNPSLRHHQRAIAKEVGLTTGLPRDVIGLVGEMAGDPEIRFKTIPERGRKIPSAKNALFRILEDAGADPEFFQQNVLEDGNYTSKGRPITKVSQITDKVVLDILNDFQGENLKLLIDPSVSDDNPEFLELKALRERLIEKPRVEIQRQESIERERREEEEKKREKEAPEIEKEMITEAVRQSMADVEGKYDYETEEEDEGRVKEDLFQPMVVGLKPERLTQEEITEKLKNIDSNKMSEVSELDSDLESILSRGNMGRPLPQPRDPLADPVLRRVNQNTAFLSNDIVPPAYEMNREGIVREGREMRRDPDPRVEQRQPLLVQDLVLEGDANRDREIERIANRNIGGNNMNNMEQNYFLRAANEIRRRQIRVMGEPDDEEYDIEEKDELEFGDDMLDRTPFDEDDEGLSNRELIKRQLDRLQYGKKGKWSGMDPKSSQDWRRITSERAKENQLLTGSGVNYLRDKEIPWKHPTRTFSNNYVNLIRNSNRSMTLAMGQFLP